MRIAIVGDYPLNSTLIQGGVQAAFHYLVRGLARIHDLHVHLITFRPQGWAGPAKLKKDGVTVHLLPAFPRYERLKNYRTYQTMLNQQLAQIKPDVVHAQDTTAHAYVALRSGYPAVVTAHGIRYEDGKYYGSFGRRLRNYFDSLVIERYIMRHTYHLIAISRYVTRYFDSLFRPEIQVHYVPNAIDEKFFNITARAGKPTVLFVGRVTPLKRVMDLVQAFTKISGQIPEAQLRIAGECRSEPVYAGAIREFIAGANLEERIHLLGPLTEEAILQEYARCSLLALPSVQENLPMVIAQAMAAGKPVLATRVGGVPEMVNSQTGILINPGDVNELAAALLHLLQNPPIQKQMGQAGRRYALQTYHVDTVARQTCNVYRQVVKAGVNQTHLAVET